MAVIAINGADVRTPAELRDALNAVAEVYRRLVGSTQRTRDNQIAKGVEGAPLTYLTQMNDAALMVSKAAKEAAAEMQREVDVIAATVGANKSLHKTQAGAWTDPRNQ